MAEPVEVDRYDLEPVDSLGTAYTIGGVPSPTGEACMWDDVAPLLAELATLREHPDDARHRRLLEAAREAGKTWAAMRGAKAPKLQALVKMEHAAAIKELRAIVAEIDQAEASHA